MNKKYLYLIIGLLMCTSAFLAYQVSQASPAIPNPGHGTSALEGNASLNMASNKIINLATPTVATDAATKAYVDAAGSKVAYRHLVSPGTQVCPAVTDVTCRVKVCSYSGSWAFAPMPCAEGGNCTNGAICYYSSL